MLNFPSTPEAFLADLQTFRSTLDQAKLTLTPLSPGWYPFNSFTGLEIGLQLIAPVYTELTRSLATKPIADIGCGNGDIALLFAHWGAAVGAGVDAIDWPPTNYNQMQGIETLARALNLPVARHRLNLDNRFEFPGHYGFALFLGALYHLQNPYYVLDRLAHHTDWCLLSTRIAQRTTATGIRIAEEPLAYLASGIEINSDATNYWIFSLAGLLRIVQRTRWTVRGIHHAGCLTNSNPSAPEADERVFLLLQSHVSFPGLQARPTGGWYGAEGNDFCWTANGSPSKSFCRWNVTSPASHCRSISPKPFSRPSPSLLTSAWSKAPEQRSPARASSNCAAFCPTLPFTTQISRWSSALPAPSNTRTAS